jgi:TRAP-type C4-dicarboxylate transport system permease small subunit
MKHIFNGFEKFVTGSSKWLDLIAGFALMLMVILVVADICGNKFLKTPVPGGIELVSLLSVVAISFAIAQTQLDHGHIEVEMLVTKLPKTVQKVISIIVHLFSITLFIVLAVRSFRYGLSLQSSGEVSMTLLLPFYPFVWAMGVCAIVVALVLIMQLFQKLREN